MEMGRWKTSLISIWQKSLFISHTILVINLACKAKFVAKYQLILHMNIQYIFLRRVALSYIIYHHKALKN